MLNMCECDDEICGKIFYNYYNSSDLRVSNKLNVCHVLILISRVGVDEEVEMLPYSGGRSVSSSVFYN